MYIFNYFPLFDETFRHIELCNSVISHKQRNPPNVSNRVCANFWPSDYKTAKWIREVFTCYTMLNFYFFKNVKQVSSFKKSIIKEEVAKQHFLRGLKYNVFCSAVTPDLSKTAEIKYKENFNKSFSIFPTQFQYIYCILTKMFAQ